jgi:Tol biopolymer transport system component/predicted Ser/Thr protein kinase
VIGERLGHYEVVAKLGEGGMSVVWKARDLRLDRFVALKILNTASSGSAERRLRFEHEARAASALNHPNIVTIYDIADEGDLSLIAMEYVSGSTLATLIADGSLSLRATLDIATQAAEALAKAHAAGIIHRDLKPSNIMVTDDGRVKIVDFGIAKLSPSGLGDSAGETVTERLLPHTIEGKVVGTAAYMSPEQAEGKPVDARSDIFSFGAVLYEMVTGARVFTGASKVSTLAAVLTKEPTPPSQLATQLPRYMERIILHCLQKDPDRRVQSMSDLASDLRQVDADTASGFVAVREPGRVTPVSDKRWLLPAVAAIAGVLVIAGALWMWRSNAPALPPSVLAPLTTFPGDERLPAFSPDGHLVAFVWSGEKRDNTDIYMKPVGPGAALRLTTDAAEDTAPAWSPDGSRIAFIRRQGRAAALYLTPPVPGSERKLADFRPNIYSGSPVVGQMTTLSWFPDGKWVAVPAQDADNETNGLLAISTSGGEPRKLTWGTGLRYQFPAVSPDGSQLAYAGCVTDSQCEVHVIRLGPGPQTRGPARVLTHQRAGIQGLAWTADGAAVVYGSRLNGQHLWRVSASGTPPERIELAGTPAVYPAISRTGGRLAFIRQGSGDSDLWTFEEGRAPESFLSSTLSDYGPQWAPDGTRIAFASDRSGGGPQVWVANKDGTNVRPVTEVTGRSQGTPRWSPDGKWIAYDGQGEDGGVHIYIVDAAGGPSRRLTSDPGIEQFPSWSRDGKWVYYRSSTGGWAIWRTPVAGGPPHRMTPANESRTRGAWESWDGQTLYYGIGGALFARPVAGGPETRVLSSVLQWDFFPVDGGIYYVRQPDPANRYALEVRYFDLTTKEDRLLNAFESQEGNGLSVSPDRKTVLYSGVRMTAGDDLMMIESFR